MSRHVLVVEPWLDGSHRAWAEGYARASGHRVHVLGHAGRYWRWRMRGSAVTLAEATRDHVERHGRPDVVIATDYLDLAAYLGLTRRLLGDTAVAYYLHENQVTFPRPVATRPERGLALRNWTSMVVADRVLCNSVFHREQLIGALPALLAAAPDASHVHLVDEVVERTEVLPVGVELDDIDPARRPPRSGPPTVLWNQRWDHDKNPGALFRALVRLAADGVDFRICLAGVNRRHDPREFLWLVDQLGERVERVEAVDRAAYVEVLLRADVVASTALNEYFGVAVVEALAAGAVPVLPHALSYPELVPARYHGAALYDPGRLRPVLREALGDLEGRRCAVEGLETAVRRFSWSALAPRYDDLVEELTGARV